MTKRLLTMVLAALLVLALASPAAADKGGVPAWQNKDCTPTCDGTPDQLRDRLRDRLGQVDEDETTPDDGTADQALRFQEREQDRLGKGQGGGWGHRLMVNGKEHKFGDVPPVIKDGRVLIPVRAVTVALGGQVEWDPESRTVTVTLGDTVIKVAVDEAKATVNGAVYDLDVPAKAEQGRVVIPLRFIAQSLGYKVGYDSSTGDVTVDADEGEDEDQTIAEDGQEDQAADEDAGQDVGIVTQDEGGGEE